MDEDRDPLAEVAQKCCAYVLSCAGRLGVTHIDFCVHVRAYRGLRHQDQLRTLVLVAKMPDISSAIEESSGRQVWRFYAAKYAPAGTFNYERDLPPSAPRLH